MNERVLRRFVKLMVLLIAVSMLFWLGYSWFSGGEPGDYEVRQGDQRLSEGNYDEALAAFNAALEETPDHRGALHGRAIVFMQTGRDEAAFEAFDYLIAYLQENLEPDDPTGRGTLAAAYANRGMLHDRRGEYKAALADYVKAMETDYETVEGPGWIHELLYGYKPSTVPDRARMIHEQLRLPEDQRLLTMPERDEQQRMYKP